MKKTLHRNKSTAPWLLLAISLITASLAGCATVEGVGKDIQSAGEELEEAAEN